MYVRGGRKATIRQEGEIWLTVVGVVSAAHSRANVAVSSVEAADHSESDIVSNCFNPHIAKSGAFGCGHCVACRIKKRREWTHRMMLEAALHKDNVFVTLTYDDQNLPEDMCVWPRELQLFLKKLRKTSPPIRFFGVGEYGDESGRPHYHLALFGYPPCHATITQKRDYCCAACQNIKNSWGKGHIQVGTLETNSIQYVAGYINKKMTKASDPRLEGRAPEFARMSLRPGIGYNMMHEVANTLLEHNLENKLEDVPVTLQHGKKVYPLGRYLRRTLRTMIGREKNTPASVIQKAEAEMQPLREASFNSSTNLKTAVLEKSLGQRINIDARYNRQRKRNVV